MTAYGSIPVAVEAVKLGAFDFLTKPFRNEEIFPLLARIERQRQAVAAEPRSPGSPPAEAIDAAIRRPVGGDGARSADGRDLRQDRCQRAALRRDGCGQGSRGHDHPSLFVSARLSLRKGRLHAVSAATDRKRTVRSRKGFVHRRRAAAQGPLRPGRRGNAVPRRRRRHSHWRSNRSCSARSRKRSSSASAAATPIKADVRIIASTKRNLLEKIGEGTFREDLYYRLDVLRINIPPLRERLDDVPLLTEHLLTRIAGERPLSHRSERHGTAGARTTGRATSANSTTRWNGRT